MDVSDRHQLGCTRRLAWLAAFHATFFASSPNGLWATGTYWHLATRRAELEHVDEAVHAMAEWIDAKLESCVHRTLVHGDAKLANFCFGRDGGVVAVDFQYFARDRHAQRVLEEVARRL